MNKLKIKICSDTENFAITSEALIGISNGSWNFIQTFKIKIGSLTWHGQISEAPDQQSSGKHILVGEELAKDMGIKDGQNATISLSRNSPINRMQIKASKKGGSPLPFVPGIQPDIGNKIRYRGDVYKIKAIDPKEAYIAEETTVEIIGQNGKVEVQESKLLKQKLSTQSGAGFNQMISLEDVIQEIKTIVIALRMRLLHDQLKKWGDDASFSSFTVKGGLLYIWNDCWEGTPLAKLRGGKAKALEWFDTLPGVKKGVEYLPNLMTSKSCTGFPLDLNIHKKTVREIFSSKTGYS